MELELTAKFPKARYFSFQAYNRTRDVFVHSSCQWRAESSVTDFQIYADGDDANPFRASAGENSACSL